MTQTSGLIPAPTRDQIHLLTTLSPKIERNSAAMGVRGLVIVQFNSGTGQYAVGFTPERKADLPHVLAQGLPEEAAVHVVEAVKAYDELTVVPVLVLERQASGKDVFSFVHLDVRPLPKAGVSETRH